MSDHIQYDFLYDNHFSELKEAELLTNRLTLATTIEPYIGKYYSTEYVRKKILRQTDSEIIEIDFQIEDEIAKGILPDPNAPVDEMGNPLPPEEGAGQAIEQVRLAMDFKLQQTYAGKTVISSRLDMFGSPEKDLDTGTWTQSADYFVSYYE